MAVAKLVYRGQPGTTEATLSGTTVPTGKQWIIKEIIVCNTTASAATISLSVVPSGGTAGVTNRILAAKSIPANDIIVLALSTTMNAGDFLSGLQGTSGALTVTITVGEI